MSIHSSQRCVPKEPGGLSLVEILLVVAIIGVLAAIGSVALNQYRATMTKIKNKRNAQSIVNIYKSAQLAGLEFHNPAASVEDIVRAVVAGGVVPAGPFAGDSFSVPSLGNDEILGVLPYLDYEEPQKLLIYRPEGAP